MWWFEADGHIFCKYLLLFSFMWPERSTWLIAQSLKYFVPVTGRGMTPHRTYREVRFEDIANFLLFQCSVIKIHIQQATSQQKYCIFKYEASVLFLVLLLEIAFYCVPVWLSISIQIGNPLARCAFFRYASFWIVFFLTFTLWSVSIFPSAFRFFENLLDHACLALELVRGLELARGLNR